MLVFYSFFCVPILSNDMKYPKNSFYNWQNFPPKKLEIRGKLAREIIHDFLITFDAFHHMHNLINTANPNAEDFWGVESNYKGINKLFTLGMIDNEIHKQAMFDLVYEKAYAEIGNKDFEQRADDIEMALRQKILELS